MLHNRQGKRYRLPMLVVLFILMLSMAPAQPALAHPSAGGANHPDYYAYYPDYYEPDNSRDQASDLTRSWAPWLPPPHTIHYDNGYYLGYYGGYGRYDPDWGKFYVSTARTLVTIKTVVTLSDGYTQGVYMTLYAPDGSTKYSTDASSSWAPFPARAYGQQVISFCTSPGWHYVEAEARNEVAYHFELQILPPWNGAPYSIPYSNGC